ncbi:MAG: hypothetical protein NT006_03835 [Candidatus Aminicenantes bacterium]|nr:hypothetical protein [Candidatus Aminicenantes bacterium]
MRENLGVRVKCLKTSLQRWYIERGQVIRGDEYKNEIKSEIVVDTLERAGIQYVFGYPEGRSSRLSQKYSLKRILGDRRTAYEPESSR